MHSLNRLQYGLGMQLARKQYSCSLVKQLHQRMLGHMLARLGCSKSQLQQQQAPALMMIMHRTLTQVVHIHQKLL